MTKYRNRTIVEAVQFDPRCPHRVVLPPGVVCGPPRGAEDYNDEALSFHIDTPEGRMPITPGDWVITVPGGEIFPCKDPIFSSSYERVGDYL